MLAKKDTETTEGKPMPGKGQGTMLEQFARVRMTATPLVRINTADPAQVMKAINAEFAETVEKKGKAEVPIIRWDVSTGWAGMNDSGRSQVATIAGPEPLFTTGNPAESLNYAMKLPTGAVLYMINLDMFFGQENVRQGIWNLRDPFRSQRRTLVMLGGLAPLPRQIVNDVTTIDEELPDREQLEAIVMRIYKGAKIAEKFMPTPEYLSSCVDALMGLSPFPADQCAAMSITPEGMDLERLWEFKRRMIESAPGLSVWRGKETFDDIGGVRNAKAFFTRLATQGKRRPKCIVFIDEIEKAMSGSGGKGMGDSSGVSQSLLGTMLTQMQDNEWSGIICIGPPGAAKSAVAKATGNTAGVPTIAFDLTGMKGSLVGESEANLRSALKTVKAVAGRDALFIATCNAIDDLKPELRRRFGLGTMFFDLPDEEERAAIWNIYREKYGIPDDDKTPDDTSFTGAEIKVCCEMASDRLGCTLAEAASFIVPVAVSDGDNINRLRRQASGRFISASHPGTYKYEENKVSSAEERIFAFE